MKNLLAFSLSQRFAAFKDLLLVAGVTIVVNGAAIWMLVDLLRRAQ